MSAFHSYMASKGNAPPSLAEAAIASGLPVFPCDANKSPLTPHGFKDASTDPATIRQMFNIPGTVMIGVPTGAISGITVVDVDIKDGARGQEWLGARAGDLPSTRTNKTRSGGLHLIFRFVPGVRNSASKIAPGVDVRGEGGYIIIPPSPGYVVADATDPTDMPQWLIEASQKRPEPVRSMVVRTAPTTTEGGTFYGLAALDGECDAIRSAAHGTKHHTLNKAAYAIGGLVTAGELQEAVAFNALSNALNSIRDSCTDFRKAQATLQRAFHEGMGHPRAVPERVVVEGVHPAEALLAELHKLPPIPVSDDLMDVPGALRLFIDHCERTAMSNQPFLALAAGICLVGALAGRKYRTETDLRTNIYAVGVADSGGGKDHARKKIKKVLSAAGLTQYLGGEDIASGAAIFTALTRHPSILFQIDEFGDWLNEVLGPKAASHKKQIAQRLKTLYSSASTFISGIEYADQSKNGRPREDIQQPHACLYGTSTPGQLWSAIAGASMNDGLMARMLLFVSPCSYPDENDLNEEDPPENLILALQAIEAGPPVTEVGNLVGIVPPNAMLVRNAPEAGKAWLALRREQLDSQRKAEGTYVTAIAGRLAENAMKLALIRAISRDPAHPTIEAADIAWGRALARHCINTLLREADRHVSDNEYDAKLKKAAEIVRKHGPITERDMIRRGFKLPERERSEILRTLVESGTVIASSTENATKAGRPTIRYSAGISSSADISAMGENDD